MAAVHPTHEIDEEIVRLMRQKESLVRDLQDPLTARRRAALQQQLAAVQAHLVALQVVVDGQRNTAITRIS